MNFRIDKIVALFFVGSAAVFLCLLPDLADFYIQSKWLGFYLFAGASGVFCALQNKIYFFSRGFKKVLFIIGLLWLPSLVVNASAINSLFFLRIIASLSILLFYIQFFQNKYWYSVFLKSLWVICALSLLYQDVAYILYNRFDSFFGYINMSAEIDGLFVVLCFLVFFDSKRTLVRALCVLLGSNAIFWGYLQHTRSVYVALFMSLGFFSWQKYLKPKSTKIKIIMVLFVGVAVLFLGLPNLNLGTSFINKNLSFSEDEGKIQNAQLRLSRWANSLKMIQENPLGVGFRNFEFSYLKYRNSVRPDFEIQEKLLSFSPHNSFIDLAAEHGVLVGLGFLILVFYLIWKSTRARKNFSETLGINSVFIYILGIGLTAFPFELAWSYNLTLLCLTFLAQSGFEIIEYEFSTSWRWGLVSLVTLLFFMTLSFTFSQYAEKNLVQDEASNDLVCQLFPSNWKVCLNQVKNILEQNDNQLAEIKARAVLERQPYNYLALSLRASALEKLGQKKEACQMMQAYSLIWGPAHSLQAYENKLCDNN